MEHKLKQGYSDGSGQEYITMNGEPVLKLRWGCSCCQDLSELTEKETEFARRIVQCCNGWDGLVEVVKLVSVLLPEDTDNLDAADFKDRAFYIVQAVTEARKALAKAEGKD